MARTAADGTSVLLTTQYLEEADRLADWISIMKAGRVVTEGSPDELKRNRGGDRIEATFAPGADAGTLGAVLAVGAEAFTTAPDALLVSLPAPNGASDMVDMIRRLDAGGITPTDVALRRPTLDELFLAVTDLPSPSPHQAPKDNR